MRIARLNGAAALVRERNHSVHVGKIAPDFLRLEPVFDVMRYGRRTVHAGDDREVIARADAPAGARETLERRHFLRRIIIDGFDICAKGVVARKILHDEIVRVHVVAGSDVPFCEANDLAVFFDGRAVGNWLDRHLVPGGDVPGRGDAERIVKQLRAGLDRAFDEGDVVSVTEAQSERIKLFLLRHGESRCFKGGEGKLNPKHTGWLTIYSSLGRWTQILLVSDEQLSRQLLDQPFHFEAEQRYRS